MKNPKVQNLKIIIAISLIIITSLVIYNQKALESKIAIVTEDENKNLTQLKYTKGTEVTEIRKNDGEEQIRNNIETNLKSSIFSNKINIELEDYASPEKINKIDTQFLENNMIINFEKPEDKGTNYEYLIKKDNQEKNINFYSKSDIKGYSYSIDGNPDGISSLTLNKLDDSPILQQNIEWKNDYYLHIRAFDNKGNYSENATFKIDLPSNGVVIRYIDINSGEQISSEETINGVAKQEYDATDMIKDIEDFQVIDIEGELKGQLRREKTSIECKYAKNSRIKINYLDNESGERIAESTYISGYEGKKITVEAKRVAGYNCLEKTKIITITQNMDSIDIYYKKIPKGIVNVKYVDQDNQKEISQENIIEDYIGTYYSTDKKEIEGYELINQPKNFEGNIINDDIEVIYYYKRTKDEEQVKKEKCALVKYVDYKTKKILATETIEKNKRNKIKIKNIEGYNIMNKDDFDKDESLIDELINSLEINESFAKGKLKDENIIMPKKEKASKLSEYEIVMNCDDSDYIIYYKK